MYINTSTNIYIIVQKTKLDAHFDTNDCVPFVLIYNFFFKSNLLLNNIQYIMNG